MIKYYLIPDGKAVAWLLVGAFVAPMLLKKFRG